jgi:radical SAM enzyme (TIGR01210 family)
MLKVPTVKKQTPVSVWREKELMDGEPVDALVAVLRGRGCYWASTKGCLMCGYSCDTVPSIKDSDLETQFASVMEHHNGERFLKIYTSGSFFDEREISPDIRKSFLTIAGERAERVLVESRPEFITDEVLVEATGLVSSLEVAIGLETADDEIRTRCINKGFTFSDYAEAVEILRKQGASVRTYILLKPPFLTEKEAIVDAVESALKADEHSGTISFNPVNVQRSTYVEGLWKKRQYRPPWLWSLVEVLSTVSKKTDARLISAPSGGGTKRGAHNCGKCDGSILDSVSNFSLNGDNSVFDGLVCDCRETWLDTLDLQTFFATTADIEKLSNA